jgi:hypothetical protein
VLIQSLESFKALNLASEALVTSCLPSPERRTDEPLHNTSSKLRGSAASELHTTYTLFSPECPWIEQTPRVSSTSTYQCATWQSYRVDTWKTSSVSTSPLVTSVVHVTLKLQALEDSPLAHHKTPRPSNSQTSEPSGVHLALLSSIQVVTHGPTVERHVLGRYWF